MRWTDKPIKEKKVNNKIKINPKLGEAIESIGGELIEATEVDEAVYGGTPPEKKDTRMTVTNADKKANTPAYQKFKAGDKRYRLPITWVKRHQCLTKKSDCRNRKQESIR